MFKHVSALAVISMLTLSPLASAQPQMVVDIGPEQQAYQARTDARIRGWIHEDNREATEEQRTFIGEHWRRSARLWRIRHLAGDAHDQATIARVDLLLNRADHILEIQLGHMRLRAPVMQYAPGSIEVQIAPPPPQVEVQGAPPSPRHMWTPGYWHWNGARHVWIGGHWSEPPQTGMVFEPAHWDNRGGRYFFVDGRWKFGAPPAPTVVYEPPPLVQVIEVQAPPPPPIVEVRPAGPSGGVWIPGYWHWNGQRHMWISGHWSAARVGYRWEPDHWQRTPAGYRMVQGHWSR